MISIGLLLAALADDPAPPLVAVPQDSRTNAHLQAVSVVGDRLVWVSGRAGTYARTMDGGATWSPAVVPGAEAREFRDVHAVDARTAFLLSSGPADASAVFKTTDGGATWRRVFVNPDANGFFDCFAFWDGSTGVLYGDSVGGRLTLFVTRDGGERWDRLSPPALPDALAGEGAFAASGTCVTTGPGGRAWVATGAGPTARVLITGDFGRTFRAVETPAVAGEMAGLTSVAFRDGRLGLAVGGRIRGDAPGTRVAVSDDGGASWRAGGEPRIKGALYGVAWVPGRQGVAVAVGPGGIDVTADGGRSWIGLDGGDTWSLGFSPSGTGWAVGPGGRIVQLRPGRQAADVVTALAAAEPRDLAALEAVIGPVRRNPTLWAEAVGPVRRERLSDLIQDVRIGLAIDVHHQDPRRTTNPSLKDYGLRLTSGRGSALAALEKSAGPPVRLRRGNAEVLRYGRFYATSTSGDGLVLEWDPVEPEFAVPQPTVREHGTLVTGVVALLREGPSRARLQQSFGTLRVDRDWDCDAASGTGFTLRSCPAGSPRPDRLTLEFKPPLAGESIAQAAGIADPVVVSSDVHMTTRYVVERTAGTFPTAHGYRISIATPPDGLESTDLKWPGSPVWRVRSLRISSITLDSAK